MGKKRVVSRKQTEDTLRALDSIEPDPWAEEDDLPPYKPPEEDDDDDDIFVGAAPKEKARRVDKYEDRKEFDAEEYDVSKGLVSLEYDVTPVAGKRAYRPPKNDPIYKQKWNLFITNITERDNFNRAHLEQLSVLCDLFVEYEILVQSLKRTGYTYIVNTIIGAIPKPYPEVGQLNRVRIEIRNYMKMLGLLLVKDKSEREPEEKDWD